MTPATGQPGLSPIKRGFGIGKTEFYKPDARLVTHQTMSKQERNTTSKEHMKQRTLHNRVRSVLTRWRGVGQPWRTQCPADSTTRPDTRQAT